MATRLGGSGGDWKEKWENEFAQSNYNSKCQEVTDLKKLLDAMVSKNAALKESHTVLKTRALDAERTRNVLQLC